MIDPLKPTQSTVNRSITTTSPTSKTTTTTKKIKTSLTRRSLNLAHLLLNHSNHHQIKSPLKTTPPSLTNHRHQSTTNSKPSKTDDSICSFECPVCQRPVPFTLIRAVDQPQPCSICGTIWTSPGLFTNQTIPSNNSPTSQSAESKITPDLLIRLNQLTLSPDQLAIFDHNPSQYIEKISVENPSKFTQCQEFHQLALMLISDLFSSTFNLSNAFRRKEEPHMPCIQTINRFFRSICNGPGGREIICSALHQFLLQPVPQMVSIMSSWQPHSPPTPTSDHDEYIEWAWAVVLLQCPILLPSSKISQQKRLVMTARLFGLISFMPNRLHQQLIKFYKNTKENVCVPKVLRQQVDLINVFISERVNYFLQVPNGFGPPSQPISPSSSEQAEDLMDQLPKYMHDWSLLAASRVMTLLFESNRLSHKLPIEAFYNVSIDLIPLTDLIYDFEVWETQRSKYYTLCSYPSLLSLSSKINILTYEGKRQMGMEARRALFDSVIRDSLTPPILVLNIRRSHLILDSLRQISLSQGQLKKLIKINFVNEDGVDGGGLKKEWFLLLTRQLVGPEYGMFIHDEDSHQIWFNPASTEFEEFKLIGTILGLAIYNRVTLDVGLPSIVYRKLLGRQVSGLKDLWNLKPDVAKGLKWLLDYEGEDLEEIFQRNFVGEYEAYGTIVEVPLVPGGEQIPVNRSNRNNFVELYCDFILNKSIENQFKSFREGFKLITNANGFSLFQPNEIELLLIGSNYQSKFNIKDLQSITTYEGFDPSKDLTIKLFWQVVDEFSFEDQKKLLRFMTGSDRIPAIGLTGLTLKITKCSSTAPPHSSSPNGNHKRLPESHTCFNQLVLDQFDDAQQLDRKLRLAMSESEGFSLS